MKETVEGKTRDDREMAGIPREIQTLDKYKEVCKYHQP